MQRFHSYHSLNVFRLELDRWEYPLHKHNFYELIFIEKGRGNHVLNEASMRYRPGDLFLLRPEDAHYFEPEGAASFIFVKFTEQLFVEKLEGQKTAAWLEIIRQLLMAPSAVSGSLLTEAADRQHLKQLLLVLLAEFSRSCTYSRNVVLDLFGAVMMMVARSYTTTQYGHHCPANTELDKLNRILGYIRLHALDPEKMRVGQIARQFAMSPNYISIYIKKHSGFSIQQHVIQTRLKAAERLLKNGKHNINEIAARLGFTDASHFSKTYRKHKGISPGALQ